MLHDPLLLSELPSFVCNSYSSAIAWLKPSSIASFFAAKPSTIAKKQKPQVNVIDADEGPDQAVIVADKSLKRI